jgi:hypothetical protein
MQEPTVGRRLKRRARTIPPDVAAAVGACAQETAMTDRQYQRLVEIAERLAVAVPLVGNGAALCQNLAQALGDEWVEALQSADVFAAEEARRQAPATAIRSGWQTLPTEMRAEVARAIAASDPRTALALYSSGLEGAEAFDVQRDHPIWVLDDDGQLVESRMPLADYARAATAFGVTNRDDMFLAAATCTMEAFANWTIAHAREGAYPYARDLDRRTHISMTGPFHDPGGLDFASVLSEGISDEQLGRMDVRALGGAAPATEDQWRPMTLSRLRALVGGPLGQNPAEVARQWYQFIAAPPKDAADAVTPLAVRAGVLLGGRAPKPLHISRAASLADTGLALGDWTGAALPDDYLRLRYGFRVWAESARQLLGIIDAAGNYKDDDPYRRLENTLYTWISTRRPDVRADARDLLREFIGDGRQAHKSVMDTVDEAIARYATGGACAAVASRYPQVIPSFSRLFSGSRIMLEPAYEGMNVLFDLRSNALDRFLDEEGR